MEKEQGWIKLSILNLSIVAFLGLTLRSKMLFAMPFINYNYLLNAHSHFAFGAWATLALLALMVYEFKVTSDEWRVAGKEPASIHSSSVFNRYKYQWLLGGIALTSYGMLLSFFFQGYGNISIFLSSAFIFVTYVIGWLLVKDINRSGINKTVSLLAISAIICLILSSVGPFSLSYLLACNSLNGMLYRDAQFTYLHFQYNGFFTLAVFALLFHKIQPLVSSQTKRNIHRFAVLLCLSIVPSLFISYLWQNPNIVLRIIAIIGSILVILSALWFLFILPSLIKIFRKEGRVIASIGTLSMLAFLLKMVLQSLTIFPSMGNAVFGDRPMIIGFLHLVFLGFVTLFLLSYLASKRWLNSEIKFTRIALVIFTLAVVLNEIILMGQGAEALFIKSSYLFTWLLWIMSIWLFVGAILIAIAGFRRTNSSHHSSS